MTEKTCAIGLVGLGVMGRNLVLNIADHGFGVEYGLYLFQAGRIDVAVVPHLEQDAHAPAPAKGNAYPAAGLQCLHVHRGGWQVVEGAKQGRGNRDAQDQVACAPGVCVTGGGQVQVSVKP